MHDAHRRAIAAATLLVLVTALVGASPAPARADEESIFTVADVHVDRSAESAAAARDLALAEGQAKAFRQLVERIVSRDDRAKVPIPAGEGIAQLVQDFQVAQEKTSSVRYIAVLTVRFRPDAVQRLLRTAGVAFALTPSRPLVVLPVYRRAGALLLWDQVNPWLQAWRALPPSDGLVPLIVPPGDLADIADIGPEQALAEDESRISALTRRHRAGAALLAYAVFSAVSGDGAPVLEITTSRVGGFAPDRTLVQSIAGKAGENEASLLARAAVAVRAELEQTWKRDNLIRFDERRRLIAIARLGGVQDWVRLSRALGEIASVEKSELIQLARDEATVQLSYLGDEDQLALALAQRDLELTRGPVTWILRPRAAAASPSAGAPPPAPR